MKMNLDEAIKILDISTRKETLSKYSNIAEANDTAISIVLDALKNKGETLFEEICNRNAEGKDDEIVVIETKVLKEIIHDILGV